MEDIMSNNKTLENKLSNHKKKMDQMAIEYKKLQNLQKEEERKELAQRAAKRGVLLEKLLPDTAMLDDADFKVFLERTIANDSVKSALAASIAKQTKSNNREVETTSVQNDTTSAIKPAAVPQMDETDSEDYEDYA